MFSKTLAATCFLGALCGSAMAGDWHEPGQTFMWQGGYIGGSVGFAALTSSWGNIDDFETGEIPPSFSFNAGGASAGVQAGWNALLSNNVLWGVEGDINWSGASQNGHLSGSDEIFKNEMTWYGTFRGRVGVVHERALFYATGGLAVAGINNSGIDDDELYEGPLWSSNSTRVGFTLGAGVEMALHSGWSLKLEGLYMDFGSSTLPPNPGTESQYTCSAPACRMTVSNSAVVFRVGANKHY